MQCDCRNMMIEDAPECDCDRYSTGWQDMAPSTAKDQPMPQSREYWVKMAAMDQELILEQAAEINRLKCTVNDLRQKLESRK